MNTKISPSFTLADQDVLLVKVPLQVMGLSMTYAAVLSLLERKFPIKPDHTWAEVMGGVMVTLIPTALAARRYSDIDWRTYENAVWRSFLASGVPIIFWQLSESVFRHIELMRYAAERKTKRGSGYAHTTTSLADGSRAGEGWSAPRGDRSDQDLAECAGDA